MTKSFSLLRPPAYQWNPVANTGTPIALNDLAAHTWTGKECREKDATRLPVLPNAGLVRLRLGGTPDADPAGKVMVKAPASYWGKQNTLIGLPKGAIVGGNGSDGGGGNSFVFSRIVADAAFVTACSQARVMLGQSCSESWLYFDHTHGPITDNEYVGRAALDAAPRTANASTTQFLGGDCLVCIALGNANPIVSLPLDPNWGSGPIGTVYDDSLGGGPGTGGLSALALADLTALAAAAAKYRRFRFKIYNTGSFNGLWTKLVANLTAAGVDAIFGGDDFTAAGLVNKIIADVESFFGI